MAAKKPKRRNKRNKKNKPYVRNVSYLMRETGLNRFDSPTALLEAWLDDYRSGECTAESLVIIALKNDAFQYDVGYEVVGLSTSGAAALAEVVKAACVDQLRDDE